LQLHNQINQMCFLSQDQYQTCNTVLAEVLIGQVQRGDILKNTEQSAECTQYSQSFKLPPTHQSILPEQHSASRIRVMKTTLLQKPLSTLQQWTDVRVQSFRTLLSASKLPWHASPPDTKQQKEHMLPQPASAWMPSGMCALQLEAQPGRFATLEPQGMHKKLHVKPRVP
jgi:hypothetical protein